MRPINIYQLTRIGENPDQKVLDNFFMSLSRPSHKRSIRIHEYESLRRFVAGCIKLGCQAIDFEGYALSFEIPQIGKEFDLLKIFDDMVVNVEFKSTMVPKEKLLTQMARNEYYLRFLGKRMCILTYIADSNELFAYREGEVRRFSGQQLIELMKRQHDFFGEDFESLFRVSDYLVSPTGAPDAFVNRSYFLTKHQEEIKCSILHAIDVSQNETQPVFIIKGSAGTGKTLLLYDIGMELGARRLPTFVIHCANLLQGHHAINEFQDKIKIFPAKGSADLDYSVCGCIAIDECHRIYPQTMEQIIGIARDKSIPLVVGLDSAQCLSQSEINHDIESLFKEKCIEAKEYALTKKIRTNKEIAGFIKALWNQSKRQAGSNFKNVQCVFAENLDEVANIIQLFELKGYEYISLTPSSYTGSILNVLQGMGRRNVHHAIGQEYDKVVMVMPGKYFSYQNGNLQGHRHPYGDYLVKQQLFQGLTRAREGIAIIVLGSKELFSNVLPLVV